MLLYLILKKKTLAGIVSGLVVLCLIVTVGSGISHQGAVQTLSESVSWGLSFNTPDGIPTGSAPAEELKKYGAYYIGDTKERTIYLTFDAGYENGYTSEILDTLKKHNAKAVFFLVGNYIKTSPELVIRMVNEGHTVGNHTMTHPDMSGISDPEDLRKELEGLEELYYETTGKKLTKLYRPPQGLFSTENLKEAQKLGYSTLFWSLAYADWNNDAQPTKEAAFDKLIPRIHNGAVVLLHSTSRTNCEILDELLTKWEEMGYSFGDAGKLAATNSE